MLFGNETSTAFKALDEQTFLSVFEGVPQFELRKEQLPSDIIEMLAVTTSVYPSKGECRKMIQGGGLSINKEKVTETDFTLTSEHLLDGKYILVQKGKKNYFILKFE